MLQDTLKVSTKHLQAALSNWNGKDNEPTLTDQILINCVNDFWREIFLDTGEVNGDSQTSYVSDISFPVKSAAQTYITGYNHDLGGDGKGEMDILLCERNSEDTTKGHPICVMEIGLKKNYDFWTKLCQGNNSVSIMRKPTGNGGKKMHGIGLYHFDEPTLLCSIIVDNDGENVSGDFGVLLCVPDRSCDKSK